MDGETSRRRWAGWAPAGWPAIGMLACAAAVLSLGTLDLVQHYRLAVPAAVALSVARAAPLALCRRWPVLGWWASLAAVLLTAVAARPVSGDEPWPWPVTSILSHGAVLVAAATVGGAGAVARRSLAGAWLATVTAGAILSIALPGRGELADALVPAALFGLALVAADAVRGRGQAQRRLAEQEEAGELERARRRSLEERARIARELHDVVAHHMSVITVQAESARYRIPGLLPAAAAEFDAIAAAARASLVEMRRLLGVLRSDDGGAARAPQPDLSRLPDLVDGARRAGVAVQLTVAESVPAAGTLPPAVELAAYRIVQEALSNMVRHAPGAQAQVSVDRAAGGLRIGVANTAGPSPDTGQARSAGDGERLGLLGMRERVAMLDGTLEFGPLPGGGFRVTALLPVPGAAAAGSPAAGGRP